MHLVVNAAVAHLDLEKAFVTPGGVPRVDNKPVVRVAFIAPADDLDGMSSEFLASSVLVDATLVGQEVLKDGEGSGDRAIRKDVLLDLFGSTEEAETIA